jgi:hypothetical protein
VAVDATGVYVVGTTEGASPGSFDAFIRKYDLNGTTLLWTQQFGTGSADVAYGVAVDATPITGGVYVVGTTMGTLPLQTNAGGFDAFVRKYNLSGFEQWTHQFGSTNNDFAYQVAVDGAGVYVVGITDGALDGANLGGFDAFIRKYDGGGVEQWTRQFGSTSNDFAYHVAVDATVDPSGVYVVGITDGALDGQTYLGGLDAFIRKYDGGGVEQWTREFGTGSDDVAYGVAVDGTGVYVVGTTDGALDGTNVGGLDAFVRKYDGGGAELWTRQVGSGSDDFADDVAVDGTGVYVVGITMGTLPGQTSAGGFDAFLLKMNLMPANGQKQGVLSQVNGLLATASKHDADKLKVASRKLTESLDPSLWIDGNHLQAKKGEHVFQDEKEAVQKFTELLKDKKTAIPAATLQSWIDALVSADQAIATLALNDAIALPGDAHKIGEAQKEMGKAADELAEGDFADAIEHYKNAWKKALEAVK